jgi:hypothetical protein
MEATVDERRTVVFDGCYVARVGVDESVRMRI